MKCFCSGGGAHRLFKDAWKQIHPSHLLFKLRFLYTSQSKIYQTIFYSCINWFHKFAQARTGIHVKEGILPSVKVKFSHSLHSQKTMSTRGIRASQYSHWYDMQRTTSAIFHPQGICHFTAFSSTLLLGFSSFPTLPFNSTSHFSLSPMLSMFFSMHILSVRTKCTE